MKLTTARDRLDRAHRQLDDALAAYEMRHNVDVWEDAELIGECVECAAEGHVEECLAGCKRIAAAWARVQRAEDDLARAREAYKPTASGNGPTCNVAGCHRPATVYVDLVWSCGHTYMTELPWCGQHGRRAENPTACNRCGTTSALTVTA